MRTITWDERIARAEFLHANYPAAAEILSFYGKLASFQRAIYEDVRVAGIEDPVAIACYVPELLALVSSEGTAELRGAAEEVRASDWPGMLADFWTHTLPATDEHMEFFLRALMQPFAECVAARAENVQETAPDICPVCASTPQLGVLRPEGDGAKRWLMCSLCGTEWQYRRVVCPHCGQEDKEKLPVFKSEKFPHVQLAACEVCSTYVKCIDLSVDGFAVPEVDDLASLSMSLWARQNGFVPIHTNILGF